MLSEYLFKPSTENRPAVMNDYQARNHIRYWRLTANLLPFCAYAEERSVEAIDTRAVLRVRSVDAGLSVRKQSRKPILFLGASLLVDPYHALADQVVLQRDATMSIYRFYR